jgi:dTDP-4-dehydrorhamnose reductase
MRILVTGRSGQLARSLGERASGRDGVELYFAGRPDLDVTDDAAIERAVAEARADVVINTAAYTAVDRAEEDRAEAERINAHAPGVIARAARHAGARLIQISTDYVFDGRSDTAYREDDPTGPINVYGSTKLAGEAAVRAELDAHVIVRTSWVYSPFGRNFVSAMIAVAEEKDEVSVVDDQRGSPTSATDLAEGLLRIAERWRTKPDEGLGETFHLAGTGEASWAELAQQIFASSAGSGGPSARVRPIATKDWPCRAARPLNSRLDCGKFEARFGYRAPLWNESVAGVVRRIIDERSR